jgi:hypothetical protein
MVFIFFSSYIVITKDPNSFNLKQHTLSARHLSLPSNNRSARHPQRNSQRLECALCAVVVVVAVQTVDVHCDTGSLREAVQAVGDHLAGKVADFLAAETEVADAVGAVGEVYDGAREGFVERAVGGAEAGEACGCVEGGFEGLLLRIRG